MKFITLHSPTDNGSEIKVNIDKIDAIYENVTGTTIVVNGKAYPVKENSYQIEKLIDGSYKLPSGI